jgi:hypothetical protein
MAMFDVVVNGTGVVSVADDKTARIHDGVTWALLHTFTFDDWSQRVHVHQGVLCIYMYACT